MPSASWVNGWVTGDLVTAAEFKKGVGSIFDTTLGASAATIDINPPIPGGYAHLMLVIYARGDLAAAVDSILLRFNNDSAANYDYQLQTTTAATLTASEAFAQTSIIAGGMPANTAGASLFSETRISISNYAASTNNKEMLSVSGYKSGTASGNIQTRTCSGFWRSSAAVTRLTLLNASNFVAGTRATLYVMGA